MITQRPLPLADSLYSRLCPNQNENSKVCGVTSNCTWMSSGGQSKGFYHSHPGNLTASTVTFGKSSCSALREAKCLHPSFNMIPMAQNNEGKKDNVINKRLAQLKINADFGLGAYGSQNSPAESDSMTSEESLSRRGSVDPFYTRKISDYFGTPFPETPASTADTEDSILEYQLGGIELLQESENYWNEALPSMLEDACKDLESVSNHLRDGFIRPNYISEVNGSSVPNVANGNKATGRDSLASDLKPPQVLAHPQFQCTSIQCYTNQHIKPNVPNGATNKTAPGLVNDPPTVIQLQILAQRAMYKPTLAMQVDPLLRLKEIKGGQCPHRRFWKRLRAKKGIAFYVCQHCNAHWRTKTEIMPASQLSFVSV